MAELDQYDGATLELVTWELLAEIDVVRPVWDASIEADLIRPDAIAPDTCQMMFRLTAAGWEQLRAVDYRSGA